MRNWLLTAPWWTLSLVGGGIYALGMTLAGRFLWSETWAGAVVSGVLIGVLFGAFMGPLAAWLNRRVRDAAGDLPPDQLGRATRLARRGAVPEDPRLRRAAHRIALQQRDQLVRQRPWAFPFLVLVLGLTLWRVLGDGEPTWFWWLLMAFWLTMLAVHLHTVRHLGRRAELLADPPGEQRRT